MEDEPIECGNCGTWRQVDDGFVEKCPFCGDNAFELPSDNLVPGSWVIVAKKDYVKQNPQTLERFLRALVKAEDFIINDPETASAIHAEVSGVDKSLIDTIFDQMNFNLSMDQTLLLDLEDQARWIMSYGYTTQTSVPNYLEYLYPDALRRVKPEAVTVIAGAPDDN